MSALCLFYRHGGTAKCEKKMSMSDRHPKITLPFSPVKGDLSVNPGAEIMRYAAVKPDIFWHRGIGFWHARFYSDAMQK